MTGTGADGLLDLRLACAGDGTRTYVRERRQRFPLRFTVPLYLDPGDPTLAYVYVQNPTGGVFAGDRLTTRLTVDRGAKVHLTTQSATKVYRMDDGEARQELTVYAGERAYVENLPDALIPHARARLHQRVHVDVGPGAAYLGSEMLAPGRAARDERFAYDMVTTRTTVTRGDDPVCVDALELAPIRRDPRRAGLLADGDYLASVVAVCPDVDVEALTDRLDAALATDETVVGAAGTLPGAAGSYARMVARTATMARTALARLVSIARESTLGRPLPAVRK